MPELSVWLSLRWRFSLNENGLGGTSPSSCDGLHQGGHPALSVCLHNLKSVQRVSQAVEESDFVNIFLLLLANSHVHSTDDCDLHATPVTPSKGEGH